MAMLEFIENNGIRFKQYPENTKIRWYSGSNGKVGMTSLITIVDKYVKCRINTDVCNGCTSNGLELHSKDGRHFCSGWLEVRADREDRGWWEVVT